jgi:hypothetical protein
VRSKFRKSAAGPGKPTVVLIAAERVPGAQKIDVSPLESGSSARG